MQHNPMNTTKLKPDCQIKQIHFISDGPQEKVPLLKSLRLSIRKVVGPRNVRLIKGRVYDMLRLPAILISKSTTQPPATPTTTLNLSAGDEVRVRSEKEIAATLNHFGQLKGCSFLPEMVQYCNTVQRVLKPVNRFVDERDLRIRRTKGIVLLDGMVCIGTAELGPCDRNCYYFWREEWLERIDRQTS